MTTSSSPRSRPDSSRAEDEDDDVEFITGWLAWSVLGESLTDAADAVEVDSAFIGHVAERLLEDATSLDIFEDAVLCQSDPYRSRPSEDSGYSPA